MNLDQEFLYNTIGDWIYFSGLLLFGIISHHLLSNFLSATLFSLIRRRLTDFNKEEFTRLFVRPLGLVIMLFFGYLAFSSLSYPDEFRTEGTGTYRLGRVIYGIFNALMIGAFTWVVLSIVDFFSLIFKKRAEKTVSKMDDQLVPFFTDFAKVIVYIIGFVVLAGVVFRVNVAALLGGLGVGGLALAFAAKESLENFIASFMIFMDQPFVVGDLVMVNNITGHVEKIGFRSTRIRTIDRSFVTVPNKLMIDKPLDNLTLRTFRRAKFDVNLTYDTTSEKLKEITTAIQKVIDNHPRTNDEGRATFYALGEYAKNILVFYYIDTMDYYEYLTIREEINFRIVEIVEAHGCRFALPARTLHMHPDEPGFLPDKK